MNARLVSAVCLLLGASACTSLPHNSAPVAFALHAEGAAAPIRISHTRVFTGSADVGFEDPDCCSAAFYVAASSLDGPRADRARATEVLNGGFELGAVIPAWQKRLRLRARAGKSGTPPKTPLVGRTGYSASFALLARLWQLPAPDVNHLSPDVDLLLGYSVLSLQRESGSAGAIPQPIPGVIADPAPFSTGAIMVGIRIGADYGIDLE